MPVLVACGIQSSGKTTFVEALLGFPVGYTHRFLGEQERVAHRDALRECLLPAAAPKND